MQDSGFGIRVSVLGFRFSGFGFRFSGSGFRFWGDRNVLHSNPETQTRTVDVQLQSGRIEGGIAVLPLLETGSDTGLFTGAIQSRVMFFLIQGVLKVVFQKSISTQIRQLILHLSISIAVLPLRETGRDTGLFTGAMQSQVISKPCDFGV